MSPIDLSYRPSTYFWSVDHGVRLASDIPGVVRRRMYEHAVALGDHDTAQRLMSEAALGSEVRRAMGAIHPSLMGGEYLPMCRGGEVEVARIVIASTTYDTFCVYARRSGHRLAYRVVDEYDGQCLNQRTRTSIRPLTLGELFDFFTSAWDLWGCLAANFENDGYPPEKVQRFIADASSSFYGQFGQLVSERVAQWVAQQRRINEIEDD